MKVYSVEIASTGALDDGFIDPKTTQDYSDFNAEAGEVSDYEAKAKGWIRWRSLIEKLSAMHVIDDVMDIEIPGASSLVAPTSIKFFLTYDDEPSVRLADDTILYGEDAVKEMVSFVLTHDYDMMAMVWNPTVVKQGEKDLMPKGAEFKFVKAPKLFSGIAAKNAVTVKTFDVPNPTDVSLKLSVTPPPPQSKVIINGVETTEYRGNIGDEITWSASADHFISQNGTLELEKDTEINVELVEVPGTVIINPTPADATVKINNMERKSYTGRYGENVTWEVSKVGYKPKSGSLTITEDEVTIPVNLEIIRVSLTINPTPADAVVTINGKAQKTITVDYGTEVSYSVAKTGYDTKSAKITLEENTNLDVELSQTVVVLTINPTPADATVTIAGVEQKKYTGVYGDTVDWEVSAIGYTSKSGSETLTTNKTVDVALEKVQVTVSINATPADATVTLNGEERKTITVDYGTNVAWVVSKTGYVSQNGSITPTENTTKDVALVLEKHTFSIVATPDDATVIINGGERSTFTADYGTEIGWSVGKVGYVSKEGTYTLTADKEEVVTLAKQQITITVAATPEDATVKLNGAVQKSVTVDYGTEVSYEVSKTGYVSKSGKIIADKTQTVPVELVKQQVTLTIVPTPEDATVKLNGIAQKSVTVDYGTEVSYEVSKTGYDTKTAKVVVDETKSLPITLSKTQVTLTITPTPANATVKINDVEQNAITVDYGTKVTYGVSATGYVSKSGEETLIANKTLPVALDKQKVTVTIAPTPADATVKIDGEVKSEVTVDYGTEVSYEVSKTGYVSKSGTETVTATKTLTVILEVQKVTFAITPTPTDATVIINGTAQKSVSVDYGSEVSWEVSKLGYTTRNGTEVVNKDTTIAIELVIKQFTFTITPTPADALVTINGVETNSITAVYGDSVSWTVSKSGYTAQSGDLILTEDKTLNVELELEDVTFTIVPTPTTAIVTINGVNRTAFTAPVGTSVEWSVSADGYTSQSGTLTLTEDTVMEIKLDVIVEISKIYFSGAGTFVLYTDGVLYGTGGNLDGELGDGTTTSSFGFKKIAENVKDVSASPSTTFYISRDGDLYGCGLNANGQQGSGDTTDVLTFTKRASDVVFVSASWCTTMYITSTGELYGCGANSKGEQGTGDTTDVLSFRKIADNVSHVTACEQRTLYLTNSNELYSAGDNSYSAFGLGTTSDYLTFVKCASNVKSYSADRFGTFYIDTSNQLYGAGYNGSGQQGSGYTTDVTTFTRRGTSVKQVSWGTNVCCYVNTSGALYITGVGSQGQQASGSTASVKSFTQRVSEGVEKAWCDGSSTRYLNTSKQLYGCGYNGSGSIGNGLTTNQTNFVHMRDNVKEYLGNANSSIVLTTTGEVYVSGYNAMGQIGLPSADNQLTFTKVTIR